jgi:hypothetical protein
VRPGNSQRYLTVFPSTFASYVSAFLSFFSIPSSSRPSEMTSTVFSLAKSMYFLLHITAECMPQHGGQ